MAENDIIYDGSTSFRGNSFIKPANTTELVTLEQFQKYTEEIILCAQDIVYFANNYYNIINLDKGKTVIKLYPKQEELIKFLSNDKHGRVVCCASRQSGKTTSYSIYFCHLCCFNTDKRVLILANKSDTAKGILSNIKMAFELLPKWLKPGVLEWNKMSIKFANGCSIEVCSTSSDAARSKSVNILCIDEVAFIDKNLLEKVWTSVYPIVSSSKNSKVILVSTPNGTSNLFYKITQRARSGLDNDEAWKYFQIDWTDVPGRDDQWRQQQLESFNGDLIRFNQEFGNCVVGSTIVEVLDTYTNEVIKIPIEKLYELLKQN